MTHDVRLTPLAIDDLVALHRWVVGEAGRAVADGYLDRIEARVATLASFPDRGAPRHDLYQGLRTLTVERRLLIAYRVDGAVVTVLRIIDARRDLAPILG